MDSSTKHQRGAGRRAFFKHRESVQRQVNEGHSIIAIYEPLADALGITYAQFARYVNVYIEKPSKQVNTKPDTSAPSSLGLSAGPTVPNFTKGSRSPREEALI